MQRRSLALITVGLSLLCASCGDEVAENMIPPAQSPTATQGASPTLTPTATPSSTPTPTITIAPSQSASPTLTLTATLGSTPSPTITITPPQSASPTLAPEATPSSTPTPTITTTPTNTALPVLINIGSAFGCCSERLTLRTHLVEQGFQVVGTANDFTYDTSVFSLDLASCVIDPALVGLKELLVSEIGSTATTRTVRAVVSDTGGDSTIPDGALYSCTFGLGCTVPPGGYRVPNGNQAAHDIGGMTLPTGGSDGVLLASVNCLQPTPTP